MLAGSVMLAILVASYLSCVDPLQIDCNIDNDDHTAKWMQSTDKKSPMELISEVPVIEVDARVVACEGGRDPALGHPIEYICLDGDHPAVCKYCGLRYSLRDAHGHH
ncbi:unnamed protein product [Sphagnum jensenii]|uniref:Zinc finger CHCC-type domain-containing protein n=1 Tax=Sphagnum jensenii TaxID=128206 RepID=A0ABP0WT18_9BRYO